MTLLLQGAGKQVDFVAPLDPLMTNLIDYWTLDDATGNIVGARSGNTLTRNGAPSNISGIVNGAGHFDPATGDYFAIPSNASFVAGNIDLTLACWVRLDSKADYRGLVGKDNNVQREYGIYYSIPATGDRFVFFVFTPAGVYAEVVANNLGAPALSTWYYIVAWHDSNADTLNIQVNDGAVNSAPYSLGIKTDTAAFEIGRAVGGFKHAGDLDEVGLWKRVLTAGERTRLYNGGAGLAYPFS